MRNTSGRRINLQFGRICVIFVIAAISIIPYITIMTHHFIGDWHESHD